MAPPIQIYAELLPNLRTVSLIAMLQSLSNHETKASLSADNQTLTITHEGQSASICLPTRMAGGGTASLTLPATPSKHLTLRLQLEEKAPGLLIFDNDSNINSSSSSENIVPWSANTIHGNIRCRQCDLCVVKPGRVTQWKDLPSENWAEMMDFWHCHKPHEEENDAEGHEDVAKSKGYSSSSRLYADSGTGYVGLSYLLMSEEDCLNLKEIKLPNQPQNEFSDLVCSSCEYPIASVDRNREGIRLFKWSLAIGEPTAVSYPVEKWVSAQLLAVIDNDGVRKFIVEAASSSSSSSSSDSESEPTPSLHLWVFTTDLYYSSSLTTSTTRRPTETDKEDTNLHQEPKPRPPTRAMKVFWKETTTQHRPSASMPSSSSSSSSSLPTLPSSSSASSSSSFSLSLEHMVLPHQIFDCIATALKDGAVVLPESASTYRDWNVGFLERFETPKAGEGG